MANDDPLLNVLKHSPAFRLIQRTSEVVVLIQFRREVKDGAAIVSCQCCIDLRNDLGRREWIAHIRLSCIEQGWNSCPEERSCCIGCASATLEAQCLKQGVIIQPITIRNVEHAFQSLIG